MRLIWLVIGFTSGGLLGWWVGSYTACSATSAGCMVRLEAVSAAGTWFGAIGTIAAVLIAVLTLRVEQSKQTRLLRNLEESEAQRRNRQNRNAERVGVNCRATVMSAGVPTLVDVEVKNGSDEDRIYEVKVLHTGQNWRPESVHSIDPGCHARFQHRSPKWDKPESGREVLLSEFREALVVTFRMYDTEWRIEGELPPVRAS